MPKSSYCKKCGRDVPVGERCPLCGGKLGANTVRLPWCVDHTPVRDWMCWNEVMRLVLPVLGVTIGLTVLLEAILGGLDGVAALLGGVVFALVGLLGLLLAVLLLVFILQGDDLLDCVVDNRGIHVQQYLPDPTPMKLLLRGKSPRLMEGLDEPLVLIAQREIAWKDIRRVQLWPEKCLVLFYGAPVWWMRLALPCTPFTWEDTLLFIREKIGKKKAVILPEICRQEATAKAAPLKGKKERQLSIDDLPPMPIPEEEVPPEWHDEPAEQPEDFTSLADVLAEIQENESK